MMRWNQDRPLRNRGHRSVSSTIWKCPCARPSCAHAEHSAVQAALEPASTGPCPAPAPVRVRHHLKCILAWPSCAHAQRSSTARSSPTDAARAQAVRVQLAQSTPCKPHKSGRGALECTTQFSRSQARLAPPPAQLEALACVLQGNLPGQPRDRGMRGARQRGAPCTTASAAGSSYASRGAPPRWPGTPRRSGTAT